MKKYIIGLGLLAGMLLLSGCAVETTKLSPSKYDNLKHKTISLVEMDTSTHPSNANTGGFSPAMMLMSSIATSIENNAMSHPTYFYPTGILGTKSINALAKKREMIIKPNTQTTDYKLEVTTIWSYKGVPLRWQKAQITMYNYIRLKNTKTDKIIAQASCKYPPNNPKGMSVYSYDEIKNPNSKVVRAEADKAIDLCLEQFKYQVIE